VAATRPRLVDDRLLRSIGFTNHAIERFAERVGLEGSERQQVEPIVRDLLIQEGRMVARPPKWSRSKNEADAYLQAGEWLLFICRVDRRGGGRFDVVTVINNGNRMTWARAFDRGLIFTPPPLPAIPKPRRRRARWTRSLAAGIRARRLGAVFATHRAQRRALAAEHARARAAYDDRRARHREERERAHARHVRQWKA
jgi:hypothetical protein